jgi:hypothetical protein
MAWASALGFYSYSRNNTNLEILMPILASRNAIPLWRDTERDVTRNFTYNRNRAVLCRANWKGSRTSPVTIFESDKAAAVYGDQIHGKTLDQDVSREQIELIQKLSSALVMSHFGNANGNATTQATFGREITCLFISDGILAYYGVGIVLLVGSIFVTMAGTGKGILRKGDIPITGLGWVHFVNNIYHPEWKVGVKENKELYLIPPPVDLEGKGTLPKMLMLQGNQVVLPPAESVHTLNESQTQMPSQYYQPAPSTQQYMPVPSQSMPKESGAAYPGQYSTKAPAQVEDQIEQNVGPSYPGEYSTKNLPQEGIVAYVNPVEVVPQQAQILSTSPVPMEGDTKPTSQ